MDSLKMIGIAFGIVTIVSTVTYWKVMIDIGPVFATTTEMTRVESNAKAEIKEYKDGIDKRLDKMEKSMDLLAQNQNKLLWKFGVKPVEVD